MDNSMRLGLSQKLTLKMTPEMQLAIKILQLNSVELKNQIQEVLETNPVVELDEEKPTPNELPLEKLDERARDIIILRYYSGFKLTEIAEKLDISYSYVKLLHNNALENLKNYL